MQSAAPVIPRRAISRSSPHPFGHGRPPPGNPRSEWKLARGGTGAGRQPRVLKHGSPPARPATAHRSAPGKRCACPSPPGPQSVKATAPAVPIRNPNLGSSPGPARPLLSAAMGQNPHDAVGHFAPRAPRISSVSGVVDVCGVGVGPCDHCRHPPRRRRAPRGGKALLVPLAGLPRTFTPRSTIPGPRQSPPAVERAIGHLLPRPRPPRCGPPSIRRPPIRVSAASGSTSWTLAKDRHRRLRSSAQATSSARRRRCQPGKARDAVLSPGLWRPLTQCPLAAHRRAAARRSDGVGRQCFMGI